MGRQARRPRSGHALPRSGSRWHDGSDSRLPAGPWHVARDGLATFGGVCGRVAAVCARFAREVTDLARTEIGEVAESGGHHRGASSTMPQKENPIDSEAVVGMALTVTALVGSLYRAMEAGHERSAGEWQIEWHVVPQVAVLTAGALGVAARIAGRLRVDPERMARNLDLEQGRILAEAYLFQLAPRLGREAAHDLVYEAATLSKTSGVGLHEAVLATMRRTGMDDTDLAPLVPADQTGAARGRGARSRRFLATPKTRERRVTGQPMNHPPLTFTIAPLTKLAWRDARNTATDATSDASAIRPRGVASIAACAAGEKPSRCIGVSMKPGQIELTRMPAGP